MKSPIKEILTEPHIQTSDTIGHHHAHQIGKDIFLLHQSSSLRIQQSISSSSSSSLLVQKKKKNTTKQQLTLPLKHVQHDMKAKAEPMSNMVNSSHLSSRIFATLTSNTISSNRHVLLTHQITTTKKPRTNCVKFATDRNTTIHYNPEGIGYRYYDNNDKSITTSLSSLLWYTPNDFQKFRAESNDIATYALGDVDYQQFFLNTLYPFCCSYAVPSSTDRAINMANTLMKHESISDTESDTTSTCSNSTDTNTNDTTTSDCNIDDATELEMISKYRGLERVMFRDILQDLKLSYIKECIKEQNESCYYDVDDTDNENDDDDPGMDNDECTKNIENQQRRKDADFRNYMYTSSNMAQFYGQIDAIVAQDIFAEKDFQIYVKQQEQLVNKQKQQKWEEIRAITTKRYETSASSSKRKCHPNNNENSPRHLMEI
jgi:hypothetical protein